MQVYNCTLHVKRNQAVVFRGLQSWFLTFSLVSHKNCGIGLVQILFKNVIRFRTLEFWTVWQTNEAELQIGWSIKIGVWVSATDVTEPRADEFGRKTDRMQRWIMDNSVQFSYWKPKPNCSKVFRRPLVFFLTVGIFVLLPEVKCKFAEVITFCCCSGDTKCRILIAKMSFFLTANIMWLVEVEQRSEICKM